MPTFDPCLGADVGPYRLMRWVNGRLVPVLRDIDDPEAATGGSSCLRRAYAEPRSWMTMVTVGLAGGLRARVPIRPMRG